MTLLLSELTILTSFRSDRLFRICDTIFATPGSLSDEKYDVGKKTHLMWKIANIVAFSTKPYSEKYCHFKNLHSIYNFSGFHTEMCILIIRNLVS